jgi:hypothetical protein
MHWIDKYRVFPRVVLVGYMLALALSLQWYFAFEIKYQTQCDAKTIDVLLASGSDLKTAQSIACTTVDVIGQPNGYTALMSVLTGSAAAIFSFYVSSGPARKDP